jgi:asparagine synthase (glutamine-hydrolysing)
VLIGGWGTRSVELLERSAAGAAQGLDRAGSLALIGATGATGATEGGWRCWLAGQVTNGEELRRRFGGSGSGDLSAAIARAHAHLGRSAGDLLRGAFLLVAVDLQRDIAFVSRDHLGGRPLVYVRLGDGALFGEHERDLIGLLPSSPVPDRLMVQHWIERGSVPSGRTLYRDLRRVLPAHRLSLSRQGVAIERYWAPRYAGTLPGSAREISERLRDEAFAAVDRAATGSSQVAVRLSGGLDSACVAAGLKARGPGGASALSAVFPNHPQTDESGLIEATARYTGLAVEEVRFDRASVLPPALRHIERWGLPPVTPNLFVWEPVFDRARRLGVDVMLDGEGGDQLFGVAPFLIADRLRSGRLLSAWSLAGRLPGIRDHADPWIRLRALRVYGLGDVVPAGLRRRRRRRAALGTPGSLLAPEDMLALAELDEAPADESLEGPRWWRALAADLTSGGDELGVSGHLRREAIDNGMERRHPFLFDLDLVETALAIPPHLQFDPGRDRPVLRDGLDGYIPDEVRVRHGKSYFTPLLLTALAGREGDLLVESLAGRDAPIRSYLQPDSLEWLLSRDGLERAPSVALRLWTIAMADIWLRTLERPGYISELIEKASAGDGEAVA